MRSSVELEKIFPVYKVEYDCILSKRGDVTLAFEATLPEIFTLSDQEYESFHQTIVKAIKVLPANSIFHKQDWFVAKRFEAQFEDKVLTFLSQSSERFFNERPFLEHKCYIMLTQIPSDGKAANSLMSLLLKNSLAPEQTTNPQRLQEYLDCVGQFERILQDSGFVKLKRLK